MLSILLALTLIADGDWPYYGRDPGGTKFSPLKQIDRSNVQKLKVAWTFHTGDMYKGEKGRATAFESTPLYVDGTLFVTTPLGKVIALNPATGKELRRFDAKVNRDTGYGDFANRGVSTWVDSKTKERRLFLASIDARLIALDAKTGRKFDDFGDNGEVRLRNGLRVAPHEESEYEETSPPAVIGDVVVVGSAIADNGFLETASGEVRGYDVRTGKLLWTWHSLALTNGMRAGGANAWSIISADPERNLVFLPTGSASPDYYGGERPGDDRYANSVVALRADTGEMVWYFQTVHHDLWDYDVASQPTLITVRQGNKTIPAIAVGSKTGHLFLLDRVSGKPIFPVEERPVPASDVPGEKAFPTQPFPTAPTALVPQKLTSADVWGVTEEDRKWCRDTVAGLRSEGVFTPPSLGGSLVAPGNIGGMAWGGAAFDPASGLLLIPTNRLPSVVHLIPREKIAEFRKAHPGGEYAPQNGSPYWMRRDFLLNENRVPCNAPPWGALTAVDVNNGKIRWEVPLGSMPWLTAHPEAANWGSVNLGGPIVTAGGLVFIGASLDAHLHAFDVQTGKQLWMGDLPTSARATPMTYRAPNGKQYVVIAAGGHEIAGIKLGDSLVAFALE
jgi:quinoprotein glucose dehydrogenase